MKGEKEGPREMLPQEMVDPEKLRSWGDEYRKKFGGWFEEAKRIGVKAAYPVRGKNGGLDQAKEIVMLNDLCPSSVEIPGAMLLRGCKLQPLSDGGYTQCGPRGYAGHWRECRLNAVPD